MDLATLLSCLNVQGIATASVSGQPKSLRSGWIPVTDHTGKLPAELITLGSLEGELAASNVGVTTAGTWFSGLATTNAQALFEYMNSASGFLLKSDNLAGVANTVTAFTNITSNSGCYATAAKYGVNRVYGTGIGSTNATIPQSTTVTTPCAADIDFIAYNFVRLLPPSNGTQTVAGLLEYDGTRTPSSDQHLATKAYVDTKTATTTGNRTPGVRWVNSRYTDSTEHGTIANPYKTIQAAIAGSGGSANHSNYDWVFVLPGVYTEAVTFGDGATGTTTAYGGIYFFPGVKLDYSASNDTAALTVSVSNSTTVTAYNYGVYKIEGQADIVSTRNAVRITGAGRDGMTVKISLGDVTCGAATIATALWTDLLSTPTVVANLASLTMNSGAASTSSALLIGNSANLTLTVAKAIQVTGTVDTAAVRVSSAVGACTVDIETPSILVNGFAIKMENPTSLTLNVHADSVYRPYKSSSGITSGNPMLSLAGNSSESFIRLDVRNITDNQTDGNQPNNVILIGTKTKVSIIDTIIRNRSSATYAKSVIYRSVPSDSSLLLQNCYIGFGGSNDGAVFAIDAGSAADVYVQGTLLTNRSDVYDVGTNITVKGGIVSNLGVADSTVETIIF